MFVLDTDHMTIYERAGSRESHRLRDRLASLANEEKATTIISYEEQMRGWLSYLAKARNLVQQVEAYRRLRRHLENYCSIQVLAFDESSAVGYQGLLRGRHRLGTMDLKIASIVLAHDATLLSRNSRDFGQIPGLRLEDWTT